MSSGLPVLSVVIPCLNVAATLGPQLDALSAQDADFEWEVVIADNGSTDQTVPLATSYTDRLQIAIVHEAMRGATVRMQYGSSLGEWQISCLCRWRRCGTAGFSQGDG